MNILEQLIPQHILQTTYLSNSVEQLLYSLSLFLAISFGMYVLKEIIIVRLRVLAKKTEFEFDDIVIKALKDIGTGFYIIIPFYFASTLLNIPQVATNWIWKITLLVTIFYGVGFAEKIILYFISLYIAKNSQDEVTKDTIQNIAKWVLRVSLYVIGIAIFLQNIGFQISAVLGGLGIGGIAIAFAIQNVLGDLFSFFSIYFDKPFKPGDFIVVGTDKGTVEKVGIKSTRIKTLQGEELVLANSEITSARINNYRVMETRRVAMNIGVVYETPLEKLKEIPQIIQKIIDDEEFANFERVHLETLADYALIYELVFHITDKEYTTYMKTKQSVNFKIIEEFEKHGIEFAYPTQQLYLTNNPER